MTKKERFAAVEAYFSAAMPVAESELDFANPFELLVAVILSAQCTDRRVNMVTPALLAAYPTAGAMAEASVEQIFAHVRSVSYPNAKATHLVSMARALVERHGGEVPATRAELEALAGVGRKTASVVLSVAFGESEMAVDTHVFRVARRIGLAPMSAKTPLAVERSLVGGFHNSLLAKAHHWLILHGRYVCTARAPQCAQCGIAPVCRYNETAEAKAAKTVKAPSR